ncbi:MAG: hypothetical protein ACRBBP_09885 [Bdellovibrionales bacterium]
MTKTILSSFLFIFASTASAQNTTTTEGDMHIPEIENVIACAMMDGRLAHTFMLKDGSFTALAAFPLYLKELSPEDVEKKKQEWADWNPETPVLDENGKPVVENGEPVYVPMPSDDRHLGVMVPIENGNFVSADYNRLTARIAMFEKLFPETENLDFVNFKTGKIFLDFKDENCHLAQDDGLTSVYCETEAMVINNVNVQRVSFYMANQVVTELTQNPDNPKDIRARPKNVVEAHLMFLVDNVNYRSSFTYTPNGNDKQCRIGERSLPEYND